MQNRASGLPFAMAIHDVRGGAETRVLATTGAGGTARFSFSWLNDLKSRVDRRGGVGKVRGGRNVRPRSRNEETGPAFSVRATDGAFPGGECPQDRPRLPSDDDVGCLSPPRRRCLLSTGAGKEIRMVSTLIPRLETAVRALGRGRAGGVVPAASAVRLRAVQAIDDDAKALSPAITRAAAILSIMAQQPQRAFGPSELSRKTGIPKSSVHNLCAAMSDVGFLRRDSRGVRLHHRLAELGNAYIGGQREIEEFYDLCRSRLSGAPQTVQLGVLADGLNVIFLARHDGRDPLNLGRASEIGRSVPAHCTANGKALLAALDPGRLAALLPKSGRLRAITPKSLSTSAALDEELKEIRRRGYSTENGEIVRGLNCFGIAIHTPNRRDEPIGISFSYPEQHTGKVPPDAGNELREFAAQFAERIKGELAF